MQVTVALAEAEPAGQKEPGAAAQGAVQFGEARPEALPKKPARHCEQKAEPAGEKVPGPQAAQVALEAAPVAALAVPAGHCVALTELRGQ